MFCLLWKIFVLSSSLSVFLLMNQSEASPAHSHLSHNQLHNMSLSYIFQMSYCFKWLEINNIFNNIIFMLWNSNPNWHFGINMNINISTTCKDRWTKSFYKYLQIYRMDRTTIAAPEATEKDKHPSRTSSRSINT